MWMQSSVTEDLEDQSSLCAMFSLDHRKYESEPRVLLRALFIQKRHSSGPRSARGKALEAY